MPLITISGTTDTIDRAGTVTIELPLRPADLTDPLVHMSLFQPQSAQDNNKALGLECGCPSFLSASNTIQMNCLDPGLAKQQGDTKTVHRSVTSLCKSTSVINIKRLTFYRIHAEAADTGTASNPNKKL